MLNALVVLHHAPQIDHVHHPRPNRTDSPNILMPSNRQSSLLSCSSVSSSTERQPESHPRNGELMPDRDQNEQQQQSLDLIGNIIPPPPPPRRYLRCLSTGKVTDVVDAHARKRYN